MPTDDEAEYDLNHDEVDDCEDDGGGDDVLWQLRPHLMASFSILHSTTLMALTSVTSMSSMP